MMIVLAGLLLLLPVAFGVVTAVQANARARAAADLGAIAAASSYAAGHTPETACRDGAAVVARNGAGYASCSIASSGRTSLLTHVTVRLPVLGVRTTTGRAVAGPVLARR